MEVYNIGPDDVGELPDGTDIRWIVYWYESYGYDGLGQAVILWLDDSVTIQDLGHCSCYGPFESMGKDNTTLADILRKNDNIHDLNIREDIMLKIRKLLNLS
ncbi:MAG: hypothetical protein WDA42_04150 [Candidatus Bathyarchaeia archaeon]